MRKRPAKPITSTKRDRPDVWLDVEKIIDEVLEHGSVSLPKLEWAVREALNLTVDQWKEFCGIKPELVRKVRRAHAMRIMKIEGGMLKKAEEDAGLALKIMERIDPTYQSKQTVEGDPNKPLEVVVRFQKADVPNH